MDGAGLRLQLIAERVFLFSPGHLGVCVQALDCLDQLRVLHAHQLACGAAAQGQGS